LTVLIKYINIYIEGGKKMKSIIKYLESKGFEYTIKDKAIIIDLGYDVTWINAYKEVMRQRARIKIYKLESYKYNNYETEYTYNYMMAEIKQHKTYKDVINYIENKVKA